MGVVTKVFSVGGDHPETVAKRPPFSSQPPGHEVFQAQAWAERARFGAARGTPGETSFWRNGTPMMLMMPGPGGVTCSGKRKRSNSIAHLRPLPPPRSLPPVCELSSPCTPPLWGAS